FISTIDGRERRAPIDASEPAGIAMGEDVDALALLALGMRPNDPKPMLADPAVILHVLVADLCGSGIGCGQARVPRQIANRLLHLVERPAEIDCGRARGRERLAGTIERLV